MPVNHKINEARFFLQKIKENYDNSPDNQYYFSAFLSATFSIRDHLLEDYNKKFGLGISMNDKLDLNQFENKARKLNKQNALGFILWYKQKIDNIKSQILGKILIKKRHSTIHRETVHVQNWVELMFENIMPKDYVKQFKLVNPHLNMSVFHTDELAYVNLKDCEEMLVIMESIVHEAHEKYPNELADVGF